MRMNLPLCSQTDLSRNLQPSQDPYGHPHLSGQASFGSKQVRSHHSSHPSKTNSSPAIFCNVFLSGFDGTITASTYAVIGSDFDAANTVSWITTSYLITTTAFQPLYGRFSDVLGRRACFFTATITFSLGCLGCGLAPDVIFLNLMRGLTGLGGGGLVTMATIINSDIIPLQHRGMYQAVQNGLLGFGAICGASLGGVIADSVGWRWCFLCQVPVSMAGLVVGYCVIKNPPPHETVLGTEASGQMSVWRRIDFLGAVLLVLGLSSQLTALSLGGNQYPWTNIRVIVSFVVSVVILIVFVWVEWRTKALPVLPLSMLRGRVVISNMVSNVLVGMSAFAVSISCEMRRAKAYYGVVSLHDPTLLPSGTVRVSIESWYETRHPLPRDTSRWTHSRLRHEPLGNAQSPCPSRVSPHVNREWCHGNTEIP
jgi:MFS family permease